MALTDITYFEQRLIVVPNLNREEIEGQLNDYINLHEPDYREKTLGYQLNKEFQAGLEEVTIDEKWANLRDGAEYLDSCGKTQKWKGFNNSLKESPIAYYIYFNLVREDNNPLSSTGVIFTNNENSSRITPLFKTVDAYNYMVRYNRKLAEFIEANEDIYTSYDPSDKMIKSINYFGI